MVIKVGREEYTIEFNFEASLYGECTEKVINFMRTVGEVKNKEELKEMISSLSDIPNMTLTLFYGGLLEHHGEEGDGTVLSKKDAKVTEQFIYLIDNKAVGLLTCSIKREYVAGCNTNKVAYLEGLYVLPEYRRQKIGSKLLDHFKLWAKNKGCKEMASDIEIENDISLQFHKKNGFEVVETTIHLKTNI